MGFGSIMSVLQTISGLRARWDDCCSCVRIMGTDGTFHIPGIFTTVRLRVLVLASTTTSHHQTTTKTTTATLELTWPTLLWWVLGRYDDDKKCVCSSPFVMEKCFVSN